MHPGDKSKLSRRLLYAAAGWTAPVPLEAADAEGDVHASVESFMFPIAPASPHQSPASRPPGARASRASQPSISQVGQGLMLVSQTPRALPQLHILGWCSWDRLSGDSAVSWALVLLT